MKRGDVFAFFIEQKNQYGIIQVLGGRFFGGYNVRVFYRLMDNIAHNTIHALVHTTDFYYINDFSASELAIGKRLGNFTVPKPISPSKYTRRCERKQNGSLHWYVMEDMRVVKVFKKFDETLKALSPADSWGIQYIKRRWLDGFTLDNWHELEEKWYVEYLETYEPDKIIAKKRTPPFEQWAKCGKVARKPLHEINLLFESFILQISAQKNDTIAVQAAIGRLIEGLNNWNLQNDLIETEEREELIEYIYDILDTYHCKDLYDAIESLRQW